MSKLQIDIEEFTKTANLFNSAAINCKSSEQRVKSVTEDLLRNWKGDTQKAFQKEYNDLIKGMYNYDEILRMIADDLNKIAQSFREADEEIKRNLMK
ncbi:WXG100 family type VII secretion target [Clostridium sp.]|uniref:WXG100 family type VII secretion target n=1 Tax=Clostridium sp. TaxID=1506 RepID=UPI0025B8A430|nr:WXG100 family type VII secretion target [Clostridium sp.]